MAVTKFEKPMGTEVQSLSEQIGNLESKRNWTKILEETTTADTAFDKTDSVTWPNTNTKEIMLTLQRVSNGRTFATSICPAVQFNSGALYTMGMFTLYSGVMGSCSDIVVNAVAIDAGNDSIEVAMPSCSESIKIRVYAR